MKVIFEFNPSDPEDRDALIRHQSIDKVLNHCWEFEQFLRRLNKHEEEVDPETLQKIRDLWYSSGLDFDQL